MRGSQTARDVLDSARPLYLLSAIFGLAPFTLRPSHVAPSSTSASRSAFPATALFTATWIALILLYLAYGFYYNYTVEYKEWRYSQIITDTLKVLSGSGALLVALGLSLAGNGKRVATILLQMAAIDKELVVDYRLHAKAKRFVTVQLIVIIPLLGGLYYQDCSISGIRFLPSDLIHFMNTILSVQYVNCVLMVRLRYEMVNQRLLHVFGVNSVENLEDAEFQDSAAPIFDVERSNLRLFQLYEPVLGAVKATAGGRLVRGSGPARPALAISPAAADLHVMQMRQLHLQLFDVAQLVNAAYGLPMLLQLLNGFLSLVSYVYTAVERWDAPPSTSSSSSSSSGPLLALVAGLCAARALPLAAAACAAEAACASAARAAPIAHRLLLRLHLAAPAPSARAQLQLAQLAQQLLHTRVAFSAAGFFEVDAALLYAAAGAVTTYLVILLQFLVADR